MWGRGRAPTPADLKLILGLELQLLRQQRED